jgi:hypothetical protein
MSQHLEALQRANEVRFGMAAVKAEISAGQLTIPEALEDERAQRMILRVMLSAQVRWGATRTGRLLRSLGISEYRKVGELTRRQHDAVVRAFTAPAATPAEPSAPPAIPPGMEPERQDARVVAALLKGPATRVELGLRIREMQLAVDDVDAALRRLCGRGAVVLCAPPRRLPDWCPRCEERTGLPESGRCPWCSKTLVEGDQGAQRQSARVVLYTVRGSLEMAA